MSCVDKPERSYWSPFSSVMKHALDRVEYMTIEAMSDLKKNMEKL